MSASNVINSLKDIYSTCKNYNLGIIVIAVTITPCGNYILWNKLLQKKINMINNWILSKPANVDYSLDLYNTVVVNNYNFNPVLTDDGLHPNDSGCELIANYLWNNLLEFF